jgi:hypothetical protein
MGATHRKFSAMSKPTPITIKGDVSTKEYAGTFRHTLKSGRFGKKHLVVTVLGASSVMTLCGNCYDKGIFVTQFDVYDEDTTCSFCRQFALL